MSFLRILAAGALSCVLLILPAAASAQETSLAAAGPDPTTLRAIEAQVAQLRGLQSLTDVSLRVLDQPALQQYLLEAFDRDYLPYEREADQKVLVALGLLKPTDDLVQIQLDLLQGQVIGVYDPDDKLMFVVASGGAFGPAERVTYAHEFNHALQDQHYDLNVVAPKHPVSNDRSLAAHAVVEGDAVLLQTLWAASNLTQDDLVQLSRSSSGGDDSLARVPLVVRTELLFPYIEGFSFVRQAYRDAGNSYAAVDELLKNPPQSTSEIMHPARYRDGARPVEVDLPDVTPALGADWRRVGSGVLGELDLRVLIEQYGDRTEASRVAAGWSGDRWLLVEKDGRSAIVLKTTWESEVAAGNFFSAYRRGLRARFNSAFTEEDSDVRQALTGPISATDLRVAGRDVLAVIAFDRQTANALVGALTASGS